MTIDEAWGVISRAADRLRSAHLHHHFESDLDHRARRLPTGPQEVTRHADRP